MIWVIITAMIAGFAPRPAIIVLIPEPGAVEAGENDGARSNHRIAAEAGQRSR